MLTELARGVERCKAEPSAAVIDRAGHRRWWPDARLLRHKVDLRPEAGPRSAAKRLLIGTLREDKRFHRTYAGRTIGSCLPQIVSHPMPRVVS